jgi:hypothetical protein
MAVSETNGSHKQQSLGAASDAALGASKMSDIETDDTMTETVGNSMASSIDPTSLTDDSISASSSMSASVATNDSTETQKPKRTRPLSEREKVLSELLHTERDYVRDLSILIEVCG